MSSNKKKSGKKTVKSASRRKTKAEEAKDQELKEWIEIVLLGAIAIIAYMQMGVVGVFLSRLCRFLFGRFYFIMMGVVVVQILITMINRRSGNTSSRNPAAVLLIVCALLLWCSYADTEADLRGFEILKQYALNVQSFFSSDPAIEAGGGIFGALLLSITTLLVDRSGTVLIIVVLFIIAALLLVNLEVYKQAFATIADYFRTPQDDGNNEEEPEEDEEEEEPIEAPSEPCPASLSSSQPSVKMLSADPAEEPEEPVREPVRPIQEKEPEPEPDPYTLPFQNLRNQQPEPSAFGIRADEGEPEDHPEPQEEETPRSIFMTVDELVDHQEQPEEEKPEEPVTEPEPVPEPEPEPDPEPEPEPVPAEIPETSPAVRHPEDPDVQVPETPEGSKPKKPYRLPKLSLLDPIPPRPKDDPNVEAAREKGELLIQVLRNFDIEARLMDTHIGPAVTKFEVRPEANVKVSRILNLTEDLKMQLAVRDIRIEAPIPGHNAVGVEIPNVTATPVKMKELIQKIPEKEQSQPLVFILGKDLLGNCVTCRLDKMPHLLIAGATGSGKSVCMNAIITSFLLRTKPDEVKLLLVDPKKVEFTPYQKVPHLIGPVINDPMKANNALKVIVRIMDERYDMFSKAGVRNIQGFNTMVENSPAPEDGSPKPKKMPYIVVIIDEMADLMAVAGKEVETSIQRITQLARAAGIHLIIATQRPSTDVITGIIKANIPSRIAFAVSSGIDSRTILDHVGAERLLGNGDMLYMPIGAANATRVQGVFVTDDEVRRITEYVSSEAVPMYDDAFVLLDQVDGEGESFTGKPGEDADPLYEEVKDYVIDVQKASTSLLQRRFGIGYNRAARMIDLLEAKGIIGPAQGSKPREVFIKKDNQTSHDND